MKFRIDASANPFLRDESANRHCLNSKDNDTYNKNYIKSYKIN